jgi:hypothetical protein
LLLSFQARVSLCSSHWPGTRCIAQGGFKFVIPLPQPSKCWDYRHAPSCLAPKQIKGKTWHEMSVCSFVQAEESRHYSKDKWGTATEGRGFPPVCSLSPCPRWTTGWNYS